MTKLTLITINPACLWGTSWVGRYNNASGLQKTMESVLAQTSTDFEYIVIDGASTDGSVEIIQLPISFGINNSTIKRFNNSTLCATFTFSEPCFLPFTAKSY